MNEDPTMITLGVNALTAFLRDWSAPVVLVDPDAEDAPIIFANPAFLELTGYPAHEVLGRNCRFLQCAETDRNELSRIAGFREAKGAIEALILNERRDGERFMNHLFVEMIRAPDGGRLALGSQFAAPESPTFRGERDPAGVFADLMERASHAVRAVHSELAAARRMRHEAVMMSARARRWKALADRSARLIDPKKGR